MNFLCGGCSGPGARFEPAPIEKACFEPGTIENTCRYGGAVYLESKMLDDSHVPALVEAVEAYKVEELDLNNNQFGVDGAKALAAGLAANATIAVLM